MHPTAQLLLARAERDFEETYAYTMSRLRESGLFGRPLELGVQGALTLLELKPRFREDVKFLLALAERVAEGEPAEVLAEEHLDRVLRVKELALVARLKHPAYAKARDMALDLFRARLPDLARMVAVKDPPPVDYEEIVRRAFPSPEAAKLVMLENRQAVLDLIAHVERHPDLLRIPASWMPALNRTARDLVEWEAARLIRAIDVIFTPTPTA